MQQRKCKYKICMNISCPMIQVRGLNTTEYSKVNISQNLSKAIIIFLLLYHNSTPLINNYVIMYEYHNL